MGDVIDAGESSRAGGLLMGESSIVTAEILSWRDGVDVDSEREVKRIRISRPFGRSRISCSHQRVSLNVIICEEIGRSAHE